MPYAEICSVAMTGLNSYLKAFIHGKKIYIKLEGLQ
jgi:hypothetical protein